MSATTDSTPSPDGGWTPADPRATGWVAWANSLPFARDLGLECTEFGTATAAFRMEKSTLTPNPNGAVNGGLVAAAADQIMGAMTMRVSDEGLLPATGSLHIQYHRPALPPLTFVATSLGGGRRTKFIEVVVEDRIGRRCATSQGTMIAGGSRLSIPPGA